MDPWRISSLSLLDTGRDKFTRQVWPCQLLANSVYIVFVFGRGVSDYSRRKKSRVSIFTYWRTGGTRFSSFDGNPSVSDRRQLGIPRWVRSSVPARMPWQSSSFRSRAPTFFGLVWPRPWFDTFRPHPLDWNDTDIQHCLSAVHTEGKPPSEIQNIPREVSFSNGTSQSAPSFRTESTLEKSSRRRNEATERSTFVVAESFWTKLSSVWISLFFRAVFLFSDLRRLLQWSAINLTLLIFNVCLRGCGSLVEIGAACLILTPYLRLTQFGVKLNIVTCYGWRR